MAYSALKFSISCIYIYIYMLASILPVFDDHVDGETDKDISIGNSQD